METKRWYSSKTVWAGIVAILLAAYNAASSQFGLPIIPEYVYTLLAAFGIYSRVSATKVIK